MKFSFSLTLKGGQYQCTKGLAKSKTINPSATSSTVDIAFTDTNTGNHYASDFTVAFMKDLKYGSSQFISGNDNGADYFSTKIADLTGLDVNSNTQGCMTILGITTTSVINTDWNYLCIMNGCGSLSYYCTDTATFIDQIKVYGFTNVIQPVVDTINPSCNLNGNVVAE